MATPDPGQHPLLPGYLSSVLASPPASALAPQSVPSCSVCLCLGTGGGCLRLAQKMPVKGLNQETWIQSRRQGVWMWEELPDFRKEAPLMYPRRSCRGLSSQSCMRGSGRFWVGPRHRVSPEDLTESCGHQNSARLVRWEQHSSPKLLEPSGHPAYQTLCI